MTIEFKRYFLWILDETIFTFKLNIHVIHIEIEVHLLAHIFSNVSIYLADAMLFTIYGRVDLSIGCVNNRINNKFVTK